MPLTPNELISVPDIKTFYEIRDTLNLSARQSEIFTLYFGKRYRAIDIAEMLYPPVCEKTVFKELKVIREKLKWYASEKAT